MKLTQKNILVFLLGVACLSATWAIYAGILYYQSWATKPLAPPLPEPLPTWTLAPTITPVSTGTLAPLISFDTPTSTHSEIACVGNMSNMTILVIGADAHAGDYKYGRADAIRAARVDFLTQRVTILEFPRDLWVKIPEIKDNIGVDRHKLNTAYFFGNPGLHYWDHPSQGPGLLARTLDLNFGLKVDHYVAISMDVFIEVVDAIGGIDVNLDEKVDGRTPGDRSSRLVFPAGEQHLDGNQALTLARIRNISVFERAENQDIVLCALRKKLAEPATITQTTVIISAFMRNIQTDLTPEQIGQLACFGVQISPQNIIFSDFPRNLFTSDRMYDPLLKQKLFIWNADFDILSDYVARFNSGTWPTPSSSFTTPDPAINSCQ